MKKEKVMAMFVVAVFSLFFGAEAQSVDYDFMGTDVSEGQSSAPNIEVQGDRNGFDLIKSVVLSSLGIGNDDSEVSYAVSSEVSYDFSAKESEKSSLSFLQDFFGKEEQETVKYNFSKSGSVSQSASSASDFDFSFNAGSSSATSFGLSQVNGRTSVADAEMLSEQVSASGSSLLSVPTSSSASGESMMAMASTYSFSRSGASTEGVSVVSMPAKISAPFADLPLDALDGPAKLPGGKPEEPFPPIGDGAFVLLFFALAYGGVLYRKHKKAVEE